MTQRAHTGGGAPANLKTANDEKGGLSSVLPNTRFLSQAVSEDV